jgi:solute carrier family 34 (sodium-dependent phosphate cotransporter)
VSKHAAHETSPPDQGLGRIGGLPVPLRLLLLLLTLFVFFVSINLMGDSLKALTKTYVKDLLSQATSNPMIGLMLGILTTSIIQSSSTTTSIVVAFAASGTIELRGAIPIIMGANIGTTVTNTLVAFGQVRRPDEFRRALAAGTVHDWFNILATSLLFPLEITTHVLEKSALWVKGAVIGTSFGKVGGLKTMVKPIVNGLSDFFHYPGVSLAVALLILFFSLAMMVKVMRSIFIQKMARIMDRVLFRNAATAMLVGIIFTILVQSSSVTTSLVVPLVGAGILTLNQIFPYTLGANIGTTVTAFLAALALAAGVEGNIDVDAATRTAAGVGVTVAVVHLLFNIFGIVLIYPLKRIPIAIATKVANYVTVSRKRAVLFIVCYFLAYLVPLTIFLIFEASI